jgi:hypothetical protein
MKTIPAEISGDFNLMPGAYIEEPLTASSTSLLDNARMSWYCEPGMTLLNSRSSSDSSFSWTTVQPGDIEMGFLDPTSEDASVLPESKLLLISKQATSNLDVDTAEVWTPTAWYHYVGLGLLMMIALVGVLLASGVLIWISIQLLIATSAVWGHVFEYAKIMFKEIGKYVVWVLGYGDIELE